MANTNTTIEWTDATWNVVTGCTKVSQGCKNCYAERVFPRTAHGQRVPVVNNGRDPDPARDSHFRQRVFTDVRCHPERLEQPLHWKKPKRIFVNSMSDLFHEDVPFEFIDQVFAVMALCPQHTFQILTKRCERMMEYIRGLQDDDRDLHRLQGWACQLSNSPCAAGIVEERAWPLPNVWLGVSVENQDTLHRIDTLKDIPAAVRFVSFEPLLEDLGAVILDGIHWAICGSESGSKARGYDTQWFESIARQCEAQHVAFFMKQLTVKGRKVPFEEWPGYLQIREYPSEKA